MTLHNKVAKTFVRFAAYFMTRRQNLHYNISSQQKLNTNDEYVPNSAQIKSEMAVEKVTKEVEDFQSLSNKHSQVIVECQLKLNSLVIEAEDLDLVEKIILLSYPSWNWCTIFQRIFGIL